MSKALVEADAEFWGYSTCAPRDPSLYKFSGLENQMLSNKGRIRVFEKINRVFNEFKPEIVIHMAAQSIVRTGYEQPLYTYETNVILNTLD